MTQSKFDGMTCKCGFKTNDEEKAMRHVQNGCNAPEPKLDLAEISPELAAMIKSASGLTCKSHQDRLNAIAATVLELAEFAEYCLDQCSWDNEPDGGSIQDKAEELGFLELRPIDPEDSIDGETEHYFCKWTPAARKGDADE